MDDESTIELEVSDRERAALIAVMKQTRVDGDDSHLRFNRLWCAIEEADESVPIFRDDMPEGKRSRFSATYWDVDFMRRMFGAGITMPGPLSHALHRLHKFLRGLEGPMTEKAGPATTTQAVS